MPSELKGENELKKMITRVYNTQIREKSHLQPLWYDDVREYYSRKLVKLVEKDKKIIVLNIPLRNTLQPTVRCRKLSQHTSGKASGFHITVTKF